MLPLESSISPPLKAQGFRKKSRTWWRTGEDTIQVVNLQKSPFGQRLYINLGVYVRQLGQESNPAQHNCHVQTRLEKVAAERYWNGIVSAESDPAPSSDLIAAVLTDGIAWLNQVSTIEGIRSYIRSGGSKKGAVIASVRELID
jgi:hypothetical protein